LAAHFTRGYFDGDGCISKIGRAEYRLTIVGPAAFLEGLAAMVRASAGIAGGSIHQRVGVAALTWCGTDRLQAIRRWLYRDASVWLDRKRAIFDAMPLHRGVSRFKYVYRSRDGRNWIARRYVEGKMRTIGQYPTEEGAAAARRLLGLPV
jgi:hypothetical protein